MTGIGAMENLVDFFDRYIRGPTDALIYDDGFRKWSYTHDQLRGTAEAFARRLIGAGLRVGDRVLIWSESRPEWVAAFWGCILNGVAVIPVDVQASADVVGRIAKAAGPRGILVGDVVEGEPRPRSEFAWRLRDIE